MQIRVQQMEAFEAAALDRFVSEMYAYLRTTLPEHSLRGTIAQLHRAIRQAVDEGRGFGIDERFDIQCYLRIVFELGYPANAKQALAWAKDFLVDPTISAPDKLNRLESEAMLRGWLKR